MTDALPRVREKLFWVVFFLLVSYPSVARTADEKDPSCNDESLWLVQQATDCYDHADFGCAKLRLESALRHQPGCAEALWVDSFVKERDGDHDRSEALRARALKINPKLADFWEKRAHEIEAHLTTQEFSHFTVSFDGAKDRDKAWRVLCHLDEAYNQFGSRFGEFPTRKIPVLVFTSPEFLDAWQSPFIGGFFDQRDGKVRVRMDDVAGGDDAYARIARHEFAHAFMNQYFPLKNLPLWFVEGSAQFYAYLNPDDGFWKQKRLDEIQRQQRKDAFLSFPQIEEAIGKKNVNAGIIYRAYLQSEALILQIARDRGESWVFTVMQRLREKKSFDEAFQEVVGISPTQSMEHLQHAWE